MNTINRPNIQSPVFKEQLEAVTNQASMQALPNATYTSDSMFAMERDLVIGNSWASVGFTSELPEPGFAKPVDFMGVPILLVRNKNNEVQVFHNVCSHRGMCLVEEPQKIRSVIRCPYHSWAYDCDGALINTPHIGGLDVHSVEGFNQQDHGLKPIRFAIWMNAIFINLSGTAEPFSDYIAPIEKRWKTYFGTQVRNTIQPANVGSNSSLEVKSNWKLAVENYCETYHLPTIHPDLNRYSPMSKHYNITDGDGMSGQGSTHYEHATLNNQHLPKIDGWPQERIHEAEYLSLYPNTLLGIQADHFLIVAIIPQQTDSSHEKLQISYMGDEACSDTCEQLRKVVLKNWQLILDEDVIAVEGMQRGRKSPGFEGGALTPIQDIPTHHFHRWVANRYLEGLV